MITPISPTEPKIVRVYKKRFNLKRRDREQPWYAIFYATNGKALTRTTERYSNIGDLMRMLSVYFPDWVIEGPEK